MPIPSFGISRQTKSAFVLHSVWLSFSGGSLALCPRFAQPHRYSRSQRFFPGRICITLAFHGYCLSDFVCWSAEASDNIPKVWTPSGRVKPATRWGAGQTTPRFRGARVRSSKQAAMANGIAVHEKGFTVLYQAPHPTIEYVSFDWRLERMSLFCAQSHPLFKSANR